MRNDCRHRADGDGDCDLTGVRGRTPSGMCTFCKNVMWNPDAPGGRASSHAGRCGSRQALILRASPRAGLLRMEWCVDCLSTSVRERERSRSRTDVDKQSTHHSIRNRPARGDARNMRACRDPQRPACEDARPPGASGFHITFLQNVHIPEGVRPRTPVRSQSPSPSAR